MNTAERAAIPESLCLIDQIPVEPSPPPPSLQLKCYIELQDSRRRLISSGLPMESVSISHSIAVSRTREVNKMACSGSAAAHQPANLLSAFGFSSPGWIKVHLVFSRHDNS